MTMTVDTNHQRIPLSFDPMTPYVSHAGPVPTFNNPWSTAASPAPSITAHQPPYSMHASQLPAPVHHHQQHHHHSGSPIQQHQHQQQQHQQQRQLSLEHQQALPPVSSSMHDAVVYGSQGLPSHDMMELARQQQQQQQQQRHHSLPHHQSQQQHQHRRQLPQHLPQQLPQQLPTRSLQPPPPHRTPQPQAAVTAAGGQTTAGYGSDTAYATTSMGYEQMGYVPPSRTYVADQDRRYSHSGMQDDHRGFADAIEAGHGILSLSQETPRGSGPAVDGPGGRQRRSDDGYGFPTPHSNHSSVSSTSFNGFYNGGSIDSGVSDFSATGSTDLDAATTRGGMPMGTPDSASFALPAGMAATADMLRGPQMVAAPPPSSQQQQQQQQHQQQHQQQTASSMPQMTVPQSMMSQFNSRASNPAQKRHKCKICDKRFTRPSSLQTHVYSHTGEKPFPCDVPGCGRRFSVVSNLRRHHRVHKDRSPSETGSEHQSE